MRSISHFLSHPKDILLGIMTHTASLWPDKLYLRIVYKLHIGKKLHLKKPVTFTEKLNWLKVNDVHPEYARYVDKYEVKQWVKETLETEDFIIPTLGVWDSFDDIDFSMLPNKFVLKTTNGGGNTSIVICKDKESFDLEDAQNKLKLTNSNKNYKWSREYVYKNIRGRIIAEDYIETPDGELSDYKFFCFNGVPKFLFVGTERQKKGEEVKFDFFDIDFNHLPLTNGHANASKTPQKPKNFNQMVEISAKLSKNFPHVRIDLYNVDGRIYFGEITFFHFAGFVTFDPYEWDKKFGGYLQLPKHSEH